LLSAPPVALPHVYSLCGHRRAEDHFHVPEREKQEVLAAIVARKTEVVNG
jgi:hypothetical protein